jgi:hypothetical protein
LAIVTNVGMGCGGRGSVVRAMGLQGGLRPVSGHRTCRRAMLKRTVKSCGPDASAVGVKSAEGKSARPGADEPAIRRRRRQQSPILRGAREVSRKAIAQGMSDCLRCPVCSCAFFSHNFAHETAGAARIRHSLLPLLFEGRRHANLGRIPPRECGRTSAV